MEALIYEVKDKKLSDLIDVIGRYFGCDIESRIKVEVKGANPEAAEVLKVILVDGNTQPLEYARIDKRPGAGVSWKAERTAHFTKQPKATNGSHGYCRNCGEKILSERAERFCKIECKNQYNVRRCYHQSKNGIKIDEMIGWPMPNGRFKYFTEEEFTTALRAGEITEGARLVTPDGHLRVIVMQAGQLTYEEKYPKMEEVGA